MFILPSVLVKLDSVNESTGSRLQELNREHRVSTFFSVLPDSSQALEIDNENSFGVFYSNLLSQGSKSEREEQFLDLIDDKQQSNREAAADDEAGNIETQTS